MAGGTSFQQRQCEESRAREILHQHVYKTYENQSYPQEWRNLPEVPSKAEICPPSKSMVDKADANVQQDKNFLDYQQEPLYDPNLPHNIADGPWSSREAYLGAHYQILREDAIASLRVAVAEFKKCPSLVDDNETCVYKDVRFLSVREFLFLTTTGGTQRTCLEQDWCRLPSNVLPSKADQMETIEAFASGNHGCLEQGYVQDRLQDRYCRWSWHGAASAEPAGDRIILGRQRGGSN
jgi:hypothetical protein